eukprot:160606-Amphidinium_carterae.1
MPRRENDNQKNLIVLTTVPIHQGTKGLDIVKVGQIGVAVHLPSKVCTQQLESYTTHCAGFVKYANQGSMNTVLLSIRRRCRTKLDTVKRSIGLEVRGDVEDEWQEIDWVAFLQLQYKSPAMSSIGLA